MGGESQWIGRHVGGWASEEINQQKIERVLKIEEEKEDKNKKHFLLKII